MAFGYPYGQTYYTPQYQQPMPQMQPQMQPNTAPQPQGNSIQNSIIVHPVASIDEAKSVQTDFNGQLTIMPDVSHGYIYTKQLNPRTFEADFVAYQRIQPQVQEAKPLDMSEYVKRADFDALAERFNALLDQLGGNHIADSK